MSQATKSKTTVVKVGSVKARGDLPLGDHSVKVQKRIASYRSGYEFTVGNFRDIVPSSAHAIMTLNRLAEQGYVERTSSKRRVNGARPAIVWRKKAI